MNTNATTKAHNDYQTEYFSSRELSRMTLQLGKTTTYVRRHVDAVVDAADLKLSDNVLDVGCGLGKYTAELFNRGLDVEGLDLTPALIESLRQVEPRINAHVGDAAAPPDQLIGRYSAVVGFMVLHHVADLEQSFRGIHSLMRAGGRVAFLEPNPYFPGYYAQIAFTPGMTFRGEGGIVRLRPRPVTRVLNATGFRNVSITKFGAFPPALANKPTWARMERAIESVPGWAGCKAFQVITADRV